MATAMPSRATLSPARTCIFLVAAVLLQSADASMAQSPLTCKATVRDVNPEIDATDQSQIHVDFRVIDESFDETGDKMRDVFIRFDGDASGIFLSRSMNAILYGQARVSISPGDRTETGEADIRASFGSDGKIVTVKHLYARVDSCYVDSRF